MWNLWYITFGIFVISITALVIIIIKIIPKKYYSEKIVLLNKEISNVEKLIIPTDWYNEQKETHEKLFKLKRERNEYIEKINAIYVNENLVIACILGFFFAFVFLILCIILPLNGQREMNYFIAQKEYVEMAIENGSELENVAITQIVIEQNQWLANAKASAQTYGAWSVYYGIDFSQLSPIEIKRE